MQRIFRSNVCQLSFLLIFSTRLLEQSLINSCQLLLELVTLLLPKFIYQICNLIKLNIRIFKKREKRNQSYCICYQAPNKCDWNDTRSIICFCWTFSFMDCAIAIRALVNFFSNFRIILTLVNWCM